LTKKYSMEFFLSSLFAGLLVGCTSTTPQEEVFATEFAVSCTAKAVSATTCQCLFAELLKTHSLEDILQWDNQNTPQDSIAKAAQACHPKTKQ